MQCLRTNSGLFVPAGAYADKLQPNWNNPGILSPLSVSAAGMWPMRTDTTVPATRLCFATFSPLWVEAGVPVRSLLIPTGRWDTVGTTTVKLRACVFNRDAFSDDATYKGIHSTIYRPELQISQGVSMATMRTNGGGANGRYLKAYFDGQYTPTKSELLQICMLWECLYVGGGGTDTLSLQGASGVLLRCSDDGGPFAWYGEMGSGSGAVSRNYAYMNTLLSGGIDTIAFSTFENPNTAHYAYTGGATYPNYGGSVTITHNGCPAVCIALSGK